MTSIFYKILKTIKKIFNDQNLIWQSIMIAATAIFVLSGFDWWYFQMTRNSTLQTFGFSAAFLGFVVPVFLPIILYIISYAKNNISLRNTANALVQAGSLGLIISSLYKVFTGRVGLPHIANVIDTSRIFRFGIYRGGAFQGWPSSHTSVAFAMSLALVNLYPNNKFIKYIAIGYAIYIGLGVSVTIHWFSDFIAGIILGTIIGVTVGKRFLKFRKHLRS